MGQRLKIAARARSARLAGSFLATLLAAVALALFVDGGTAGAVGVSELKIVVFGQGVVQISPPSEGVEECSGTCELAYPDGTAVTLTAVPSGEWTFNGWGMCDEEPAPAECVIDTTEFETRTAEASFVNSPPTLPTITFPAENQQIASTGSPVKVEVSFEDEDPTVAGYECDLDAAGPPQPCTSPWVLPSVAVGAHTAYVFALDGEGNGTEIPAARHFSVVVPSAGGGGGETGGSTPVRVVVTEPPPPARLHAHWQVTRRGTTVKKLLLEQLPAGAKVRVGCGGPGCPFKSKKAKVSKGRADLTGLFGAHKLHPGDVIKLRIEAGGATQLIEIRIRAGKTPKIVRR
ncbi:MAG TPA: hypothetical protein VLC07_07970 [Solirubrobacterales bacterium]|nr:hypothetical protein [Solirubrobacterales bacterium]